MKLYLRVVTSVALSSMLCQFAFAQKRELKIEGISSVQGAVPGQMIQAFVAGISEQYGPPIPLDRFDVVITQDGVARRARVRSSAMGFMNPQLSLTPPASAAEKAPDIREQLTQMKPGQLVMFTVPLDLHEGEAGVVVNYGGRRSNEFKFKVANQLPTPRIAKGIDVAVTSSQPFPPSAEDLKQIEKRGLRLERGRDAELLVSPLIDPEAPDAGVMVIFKQGSFTKDVIAKITRREGTQSDGAAVSFGPIRYEVTVRVPDELELGPAQIELRIKLRGQISEPASEEVLITDRAGNTGSADPIKPHVTNIGEQRIGIGQAMQLTIDAKWLEPDPSKTLIVLEQGAKRVELKPEMNSAALQTGVTERMPAVLVARVKNAEIRGKVTVRVYNPARGERDGLSEGTPVEIVDEVVPPLAIKVSEAGKQELALLRALRDEKLKQGREFQDYDPDARYVTIRAIGLDYNPNYIRIKFEQGGWEFTLKYKDFSLNVTDLVVVRVPDAIKPGPARITIQNVGWRGLSDPVITTVEITDRVKR